MPRRQLSESSVVVEHGALREFGRKIIQRCDDVRHKVEFRAFVFKALDTIITISIIAVGVVIASRSRADMIDTIGYISLAGTFVTIMQFIKSIFKLESLGKRYKQLAVRLNDLSIKILKIEMGTSNKNMVDEIMRISKEFDDVNLKAFKYDELHDDVMTLESSDRSMRGSGSEGVRQPITQPTLAMTNLESDGFDDIVVDNRKTSMLSEH